MTTERTPTPDLDNLARVLRADKITRLQTENALLRARLRTLEEINDNLTEALERLLQERLALIGDGGDA